MVRKMFGSKRWKWRKVEANYIIRSFVSCTLHKTIFLWSNKEDKLKGAYSIHGRNGNAYVFFGRAERRDNSEELSIDGKTMLQYVLGKSVNNCVIYSDQNQALVNTTMKLPFENLRISFTSLVNISSSWRTVFHGGI